MKSPENNKPNVDPKNLEDFLKNGIGQKAKWEDRFKNAEEVNEEESTEKPEEPKSTAIEEKFEKKENKSKRKTKFSENTEKKEPEKIVRKKTKNPEELKPEMVESEDKSIKGLLPEHKNLKKNPEELKKILAGGKNWKDSVPPLKPKKIESKPELLIFEELTVTINDYIASLENKLDKFNEEQAKKELEKIIEMGDRAGYFLGNAEEYAKTRNLDEEKITKLCNELRDARNRLRKTYISIADKAGIKKTKKEIPPAEKDAPLVEDMLTNWPEEEPVEYDFLKEKKEEEKNKEVPSIDESLVEIAKNVEIPQKKESFKKKKISLEEKWQEDLSDYATWELEEEQENVNRKINNLTEASKIATDENDKRLILQEIENLNKKAGIIGKILFERKQEPEISKPKQAQENEQEILGGIEGFTSGEKIVEKDALGGINEKIGQKEQEIKEIKKRLDAYKLWGPWGKQTTGRDFNWYVDAGNLKIFKKELKKLEKERKQEIKQSKKYKGHGPENTEFAKEEKEIILSPKKKQGFFARIFGRKEKTPKGPKILSEKELLGAVNRDRKFKKSMRKRYRTKYKE